MFVQFSEQVIVDAFAAAENQFELAGMFIVEPEGDLVVDELGLAATGGACDEQVRAIEKVFYLQVTVISQ